MRKLKIQDRIEPTKKRTTIGGGKLKTSSMNKSKRRNKGL